MDFYIEITDRDGTLIAGTTADSESEAVEYILKQKAAGVTEDTDEATLYTCYMMGDQLLWKDVEWVLPITNCFNPDFPS